MKLLPNIRRWSEREGLVIFLFLAAAATHFIGLGHPREVIFDEVHFGKFVTSYCCSGQRIFDIHPPHAKLLIAAAVKLSGYNGNLSFENIGQSYGDYSPVPWRLVPAVAGTLLPLIIYALVLQLGASRPAAFGAALLLLLDNALTVQTRVISLDGLLLVGTFGSLSAYLAAERALWQPGRRWVFWSLVAGALGGLAVGSKFTGLVALGLIGVLGLYRLVTSGSLAAARRWLAMGSVLLAAAAVVYTSGWVLHFVLLTQPGSGDVWGIPTWNGSLVSDFFRQTVALHKTMYNANNGLTIVHHDSSPWWGWPFMNTPIFYWQQAARPDSSLVGAIYFIGNPLVWVGSTLVLLATLAWIGIEALGRGTLTSLAKPGLAIPLLGYVVSFAPLTRVARGLFLYHYLTPLIFAILVGVVWLDQRGWFNRDSVRQQPARVYVVFALVLLFFMLFSPLTYGLLIHPDLQNILFWFKSWR